MYAKRVSGPYPLSCITCRERRKKCDRTHPTCNRCKAGGFTCLGYASRNNRNIYISRPPSQVGPGISFVLSSVPLPGRSNDARPPSRPPVTISINHQSASPIGHPQRQHSQDSHSILSPSSLLSPQPPTNISFASDYPGPSDESRIYTSGSLTDYYPTHESESPGSYLGPDDNVWSHTRPASAWNITTFTGSSIHQIDKTGYTFYRNPDTSVVATEFITSRYTYAYSLMAIELTSHLESFVQVYILPNITLSQAACWSLYIGAKIYEATMSSHGSKVGKQYVQTLDEFGQQICATNRNGMSARELSGWLMAALELTELRLLVDPRLAYRTQRLAIPIFMQLAQTEPSVWRNYNSGPSLHRISLSPQPGLARFAIMDVFGSFVLGLPQLIVWDPVFIPELARFPWDEWIPGLPLYFLLVLCAINSWREYNPYTRNPNEWVQYERNILDWSAQHIDCSDRTDHSDSWRTVGRLATQEAFRHMILIYLYMGMGGLKSGNPRVQASCSQISQLCGLINVKPDLALSFFFASITAGVCAVDEKQRSVLWKCVKTAEGCKSFIFKDVGFTQVLDHLWRGSASGGSEVTWEDYLVSCQLVIRMKP